MADAATNTQYAYIVHTPGVVGGEARIAGHRIRVRDIVAARDLGGLTPEEIAATIYPAMVRTKSGSDSTVSPEIIITGVIFHPTRIER
jgi:uncharacterized protein (DUF433 family)